MIQEEKYIREHDSGRRPFTVPEGYFEGFTERMMTRLKAENEIPEQKASVRIELPLWRRAMRYAAAIAVIAVCVGGGWFYSVRSSSGNPAAQLSAQGESLDFYFTGDDLDEALDYELVDNQHIAYYLTEAY